MNVKSPDQGIQNPTYTCQPAGDAERALLEFFTGPEQVDLLRPDTAADLLSRLCAIFNSLAAGLLLLHGESADLHIFFRSVERNYHLEDVHLDWDRGQLEAAIQSRALIDIPYAASVTGLERLPAELDLSNAALLAAPIAGGEQSYGALFIISTPGCTYTQRGQELLSATTRLVYNQMRHQSSIQSLQAAVAGLETSRDQLLHSRNVLRALFDSFPDGLYIIDRDYRLAAVNMHRSRRTGSHPNLLVGKICYQVLFSRQEPCPDCRAVTTFTRGEMTVRTRQERSPERGIQEWEIYSYPIFDRDEQVIQAILLEQDVTDKRHLELTLAQSEKLAALGQWAASLAHELNNPLTAIIANAQLLSREIPSEDDRHEMVDLIARAGERANLVVRNLLDLSRKEDDLFKPTDINQTLQKSLDFLQHELVARSVELVFEPAGSLPLVNASSDHLQGVWLNLLTNALDSLEDEPGTIIIRTFEQGEEVLVTIHDSGQGIPADRLERIFEPFYTTKTRGRGTGLGLSVCQRIIKQHGGRIQVESQPGSGTQFRVALPLISPSLRPPVS
jgi:signal transduction histidine kinase